MLSLLKPGEVKELARAARSSKGALSKIPTDTLIACIVSALQQLANDEVAAEVSGYSGFSSVMVRHGLRKLVESFTTTALKQALDLHTGEGPESLLQFQSAGIGGWYRAVTPDVIGVVCSGTVPTAPILELIWCLLFRTPVVVKVSRREPTLVRKFVELLNEAVATWWRPDVLAKDWLLPACWEPESSVTDEFIESVDGVTVFGNDATIARYRSRLKPSQMLKAHGHRVSVAAVSRSALVSPNPSLFSRIAEDVAMWEQSGCLSPHVLYLEEVDPKRNLHFCKELSRAFSDEAHRFPCRQFSVGEANSVLKARGVHACREGGPLCEELYGANLGWTILLDDRPTFEVSPLCRTLRVKPVPKLEYLHDIFERYPGVLQALGLELGNGPEDRHRERVLGRLLAPLGLNRVCPIGQMQFPPPMWLHDGFRAFDGLVRFVGVEDGCVQKSNV